LIQQNQSKPALVSGLGFTKLTTVETTLYMVGMKTVGKDM